MIMIEQVWRNNLTLEGQPLLAADDDLDDVVALMIKFRIDPQKFGGNLLELLSNGRPDMFGVFSSISKSNLSLRPTPSIHKYVSIVDRPGSPLWLLAGFPDVLAWVNEVLPDAPEPSSTRTSFTGTLVAKYLSETGKTLETAVQEGSPDDIYLGFKLCEMAGEQSTFTLIATNTTKYYLELKRSFGSVFPDETALLAMAGIMDAFVYIAGEQIYPGQVTQLAKRTEGMQDRLLSFLIAFEALLLSVDTPELAFDEIRCCCEEEAETIRASIQRAKNSYSGEPAVANAVRAAMSSPKFAELRRAAGLRKGSLLGNLKRKLFG
jgi:hypothetical protein